MLLNLQVVFFLTKKPNLFAAHIVFISLKVNFVLLTLLYAFILSSG